MSELRKNNENIYASRENYLLVLKILNNFPKNLVQKNYF